MSSGPTRLTRPEIDEWLAATGDEGVRETASAVRALVLELLPDVNETRARGDNGLGFGAHQYGADGWGIAALAVHRSWASLGFFAGTRLPDPAALLEGSGKRVRHVKLRSPNELADRRDSIAALVHAAAALS